MTILKNNYHLLGDTPWIFEIEYFGSRRDFSKEWWILELIVMKLNISSSDCTSSIEVMKLNISSPDYISPIWSYSPEYFIIAPKKTTQMSRKSLRDLLWNVSSITVFSGRTFSAQTETKTFVAHCIIFSTKTYVACCNMSMIGRLGQCAALW